MQTCKWKVVGLVALGDLSVYLLKVRREMKIDRRKKELIQLWPATAFPKHMYTFLNLGDNA